MKRAGKIIGIIVAVAVVAAGAGCVGLYFLKDKLPWDQVEEPPKQCKIHYQAVSGEIVTVDVTEGELYSIVVPQKEGYIFKGLYDQENGGIQYVGANGLSISYWNEKKDRNLFLQWEPKKITFFFDPNGGIGAETTMVVDYNSTINAFPMFMKTGYKFIGWYDGSGESATAYSNGAAAPIKRKMTYDNYAQALDSDEVNLYAKWEEEQIAVTFSNNKGKPLGGVSADTVTKTVSIPYGNTIDDYIPVENEFHSIYETSQGFFGIGGWSMSRNSTALFDGIITEPIELFAVWEPAIVFEVPGGTVSPIVAKADKEIILPTYNQIGYEFQGWEDDNGNVASKIKMPACGIKLYPILEKQTYTINYNYNGGTEILNVPTEYTVDTPKFCLPTNTTKTYYEFGGWYDNEECNGEEILELGETVNIGRNLNLYVKWIAIAYKIRYYSNGGENIADMEYNIDSPKFKLPIASKGFYYLFEGWYRETDFSGRAIEELGKGVDIGGELVLYAKWKQKYEDYTYISSREDMERIRNNLAGKYMLIQSIDLGEWIPIGSYMWNYEKQPQDAFSGTFDGQKFRITYKITATKHQSIGYTCYAFGLFGYAQNAKFMGMEVDANINLLLETPEAASSAVGGIVGFAKNSVFTEITSNGNTLNGFGIFDFAGGIAGIAYTSEFNRCTNSSYICCEARISGAATAGGIVGSAYASGEKVNIFYANCKNTGNVSLSDSALFPNAKGDIFGQGALGMGYYK